MAILYAICEIGILFIFSYYGMDKAFKENSITLFIVVVISIIVVQLTSNITFAIAFKNGNKVTKKVNTEVREKLFKKAMALDKEYHNNHASGHDNFAWQLRICLLLLTFLYNASIWHQDNWKQCIL